MAKNEDAVVETTEAAVEVVWENPPANRGGRATSKRHQEISDILKTKPGEWAKVGSNEKNDGLRTSIAKGTAVSFRDGEYEARSTKVGEGAYDIYARFVGPLEV